MTPAERTITDAERAIRDLTRGLDSAPATDLVDAGHALQVIDSAARKALDKVKVSLRAEAAKRFAPGTTSTILDGRISIATVSAPESIVRVAKGADIEALRQALGDDFGEFFSAQVVVQPKPGAMSRVLDLPERVRDLVFASIEQDVGAGGVGFAPRRKP